MQVLSVSISTHQMELFDTPEYFNPALHTPALIEGKHPEIKLVKRSVTGRSDEEKIVKADMIIGEYSYVIEIPENSYKKLESKIKQKRFKDANLFAAPYIKVIHGKK